MKRINPYFLFIPVLAFGLAGATTATQSPVSPPNPTGASTPPDPCATVLRDAENPQLQPVLSLSLMRCYEAHKMDKQADVFAWEVMAAPFWNVEVLALLEAAAHLKDAKKEVANQLVAHPISILDWAPHTGDRKRRSALAELWVQVAQHGPVQSQVKARERLHVVLGDTDEAKAFGKNKQPKLSVPQQKTRIANLSLRHENRIILTEGPKAIKGQPLNEDTCEIAYQVGKSGRKKRHYKKAHRFLDRVLKECSGTPVRKASYMKAKVASFQALSAALPLYDHFLANYPQDPLADDVMMMKALHLETSKKTTEAVATYKTLLSQYPDGDMWHEAAFRLAFALARAADVTGAIAQLDSLARKDKLDAFTQDRALYWRGRLKIYPDLKKLTPTQSQVSKEQGWQELQALSQTRSASYYGHLALRLMFHASEHLHMPASIAAPSPFVPMNTRLQTPLPDLPQQQEELALVKALIDRGYDAEAIWVLDRLQKVGNISHLDRALGYYLAEAYGKSHRELRKARLHWPHGLPVKDTLHTWQLAFPLAHDAAFKNAAEVYELPQSMLWGLSREESAFEKDVTSWAGARGLCQLMPATAKEEAQLGKIPLPNLNALFIPKTNTLLGAQHLSRRLKLLQHPFLAIAAYNAGPGNVRKWRKRLHDYQAMDAFVEAIPVNQTRNYVRKVVGSWITYAYLTGETVQTDFSMQLPKPR